MGAKRRATTRSSGGDPSSSRPANDGNGDDSKQEEDVRAYTRNRLVRVVAVQVLVVLGALLFQRVVWTPSPQHHRGGGGRREGSSTSSFSATNIAPCGLLPTSRFRVFSTRVVTPEGTIPATIEVEDGRIASVERGRRDASSALASEFLDYGDLVISPGLIDLHVHVNEPGRETWEGFATATRAAAAGGVTTLFDMPLNSKPAATTAAILANKMRVARDKVAVDVGFWGGLVPENSGARGGNRRELLRMLQAGAVGFKAFMSPSGIDDFGNASAADLESGLRVLSPFSRPLMVHAELLFEVESVGEESSPRAYATYAGTRPGDFEADAVSALIGVSKGLAAEGVAHKIHVAHVSEASVLRDVRLHRTRAALAASGSHFTTETCPHYLYFEAEGVPDGATQYKCAPPIRTRSNRRALWGELREGAINTIGSDHSPSPPGLKHLDTGDFLKAWGGIAGLQYSLPATWTAAREFGASIEDLAEWWSYGPAAVAGLTDRGTIAEGKKADFVVWSAEAKALTSREDNFHRHKVSPYAGQDMLGRVEATFVSGNLVFSKGEATGDVCGRILRL